MSTTAHRFEQGRPVGDWTLIAPMERDLAAPLWVADDGQRVAYVRNFRVRSLKVTERLNKVVAWASAYEHNSILPILEAREVEGGVAVVSLYEEGQLLSSCISKAIMARKPVPPGVAASIALDLLEALHATGGRLAPAYAHGGLRPECVLVTRGGRARLMELGAAGVVGAVDPLAREPKWAAYAAPEQIEKGTPGAASDVFSIGVLLWEMLVDRPLFMARSYADVKKKLLAGKIDRADKRARTRVPVALADVVEQALARDPEQRFETPRAFGAALQGAMGETAERHEVSEYLEQLHVVALDTRRRSLEKLLGRAVPMSLPPPPQAGARREIRSVAPPAIPRAAPVRPLSTRPPVFTPSVAPKLQPRIAPQPVPKIEEPAEEVVDTRVAEAGAGDPDLEVSDSELERSEAGIDGALPEPAPDDTPAAHASSIDVAFSEAEIGIAEPSEDELEWGEAPPAPAGEAPDSSSPEPSGIDVPLSEAGASSPEPSGIDVPLSEAGTSSPEPSGVDVPVSEASASSPEPSGVDVPLGEAGGEALPSSRPSPAPAAAPPSSPPSPPPAAAPPFDPAALLDDPMLDMRPRRRWPMLVVGIGVGVGITLATIYGAGIGTPANPMPTPTASAPPPPPPPHAPEPEPAIDDAAAQPSASASAAASAEPTSQRAAPRPRPRPQPAARPAPHPAPRPAPAPKPPPPDEVYE